MPQLGHIASAMYTRRRPALLGTQAMHARTSLNGQGGVKAGRPVRERCVQKLKVYHVGRTSHPRKIKRKEEKEEKGGGIDQYRSAAHSFTSPLTVLLPLVLHFANSADGIVAAAAAAGRSRCTYCSSTCTRTV